MTSQTHTHTGYGIEYANGDRDWYDDAMLRDEAYSQDERLVFAYPEDVAMPVAKLKREVTTTLTITREVAA